MFRNKTCPSTHVSLCLLVVAASATAVQANINLELRPATQTVAVGALVEIGLYAVSDDPEMDQLLAAMDVIIAWNPALLELSGIDDTGGPVLLFSGFAPDPYGLNEVIPPQDGDGIYSALAALGQPVPATPAGTLITTFQFSALATTSSTLVEILELAGDPEGHTVVLDGTVPNLDVTGTLGSAEVTIVCEVCPGDLDGSNQVDLIDLAILLSNYGMTIGALPQDGDHDCDGDIDLADLSALLSVYGTTCP